jgi:hypothetical protein
MECVFVINSASPTLFLPYHAVKRYKFHTQSNLLKHHARFSKEFEVQLLSNLPLFIQQKQHETDYIIQIPLQLTPPLPSYGDYIPPAA